MLRRWLLRLNLSRCSDSARTWCSSRNDLRCSIRSGTQNSILCFFCKKRNQATLTTHDSSFICGFHGDDFVLISSAFRRTTILHITVTGRRVRSVSIIFEYHRCRVVWNSSHIDTFVSDDCGEETMRTHVLKYGTETSGYICSPFAIFGMPSM